MHMYIQCFDPLPKGLKSEREAEDDLEKDCQERTIRGRVDELENGQIGGTKQGGLDRQHDGLMCLSSGVESNDGDDEEEDDMFCL